MSDTDARQVSPPGAAGEFTGASALATGTSAAGLPTGGRLEELSLGDLAGQMTADMGTLIRQELALAKVELKEEAAKAGKGAGMFGGAGFTGYLAAVLLSFAAAWGLAEVMAAGFAFLLVGGLYALVAAALFASGRKRFKSVHGPQQTMQTVREDAQWARNRKS